MESLPFSGKMIIDHPMENMQVFNEASETINKRFYDPNFHGKDWKQLIEKYKCSILKASTSQDFRDMFNNMLGQLNASHMGLYNRGRAKTQREKNKQAGTKRA